MKRRLLNLLTLLSLVLCTAVVILWVRSFRAPLVKRFSRDEPYWREVPRGPVWYELRSAAGEFNAIAVQGKRGRRMFESVRWGKPPLLPWDIFTPTTSRVTGGRPIVVETGIGQMGHGPDLTGVLISPGLSFTRVTVSYWLPTAMTAVLPVAFVVTRLNQRQRRLERGWAGLCPACGYDLRASPGRCPECGSEATTPA